MDLKDIFIIVAALLIILNGLSLLAHVTIRMRLAQLEMVVLQLRHENYESTENSERIETTWPRM